MRRTLIILLSVAFVLVLLGYTATFSVRFTESAVLTTFGRATEQDVKKDAGLYFKWPYPIQSVTTYDTRVRVRPEKLEQQQTLDNQAITVEAFATWRVSDPLSFFKRFSNAGDRAEEQFAAAEKIVGNNLRAGLGLVSRYAMGDLFNAAPGGSKLPELEERTLATLRAKDQSGASLAEYGIEVTSVGISRIVLPESVTSAVFEAMRQRRLKLVQDTQSRGDAAAAAIRSSGEEQAKIIRSYVDRRAKEIMTLGEFESTAFLKQMAQNQDLAVFLNQMDFMRSAMAKRATLVFSASMPGMSAFFPDALEGLKAGQIPGMARPASTPKPAGTASGDPATAGGGT